MYVCIYIYIYVYTYMYMGLYVYDMCIQVIYQIALHSLEQKWCSGFGSPSGSTLAGSSTRNWLGSLVSTSPKSSHLNDYPLVN